MSFTPVNLKEAIPKKKLTFRHRKSIIPSEALDAARILSPQEIPLWTPTVDRVKEPTSDGHDFSAHLKKYQLGFSHFKEKSQKLDQKLDNQKSLINMIIHDLRCPTGQIKHAASSQISSIQNLRLQVEQVRTLVVSSSSVLQENLINSDGINGLVNLEQQVASCLDVFAPGADQRLAMQFQELVSRTLMGIEQDKRFECSKHPSKNTTPKARTVQAGFLSGATSSLDSESEVEEDNSSSDEANAPLETEEDGSQALRRNVDSLMNSLEQLNQSRMCELTKGQPSKTAPSQFEPQPCLRLLEARRPRSRAQSTKVLRKSSFKPTKLHSFIRKNHKQTVATLEQLDAELDIISKLASSCEYSSAILLNLINDLMDLAKAENNTLSISNGFFSLEQALREADYTLNFMAEQKQIYTSVNILPQHARQLQTVFGDSGRLKQVIVNLMSNALKFTDEGGLVKVTVTLLDTQRPQNLKQEMSHLSEEDIQNLKGPMSKHAILIEVSDNGQGISQEGQSKLFKNFVSLSEHKKSNERGTGLGLCICKQLIERMGGTITVQSKVGHGSTFSINLPMLSLESSDPPAAMLPSMFRLQAECPSLEDEDEAEDSDTSSSLSSEDSSSSLNSSYESSEEEESFRSQAFPEAVSFRADSKQFTSKQDTLFENEPPDAKKPRLHPQRSGSNLTIQGSSQFKFKNTKELQVPKHPNGNQTGHVKGRSKAVSFSFPFRSMETSPSKVINLKAKRKLPNSLILSPPPLLNSKWAHLRVLIVNDEPVTLMFITGILAQKLGIDKVETAANGQIAVNKAAQESYDLIIMDITMPVLDGFEATRQIKLNERNKEAVVVALSASSFTDDLVAQCKEAGFSAWLTTPLEAECLVQQVLAKYFQAE